MSETTHCQRVLEVLVDGRWLAHHDRRERILAIASGFPLTPAQRRWLDKVEVTEDCWLWTHCDQGHEFTPGNTRRRADCNGRVCITCARAATARYREKNREKMREKDRLLKRALREKRGVPERWPGRIHPTLGGGAT